MLGDLIPMGKVMTAKIDNAENLAAAEQRYRLFKEEEIIPLARGTGFVELAETVIPDRRGAWESPLALYLCRHNSQLGTQTLCRKAKEYLQKCNEQTPLDILSVSAGMDGDSIVLVMLVRLYSVSPNINNIYNFFNDSIKERSAGPRLVIPESAKHSYSVDDRMDHDRKVIVQNKMLKQCSEETPFLNSLDDYTPVRLPEIDDTCEPIYDLQTQDMQISTMLSYQEFIDIFRKSMRYVTSVERDMYYEVLRDNIEKETFTNIVEAYIEKNFIRTGQLPKEDFPMLIKKMDRALFELYIVQDLIDNPEITDIKITSPDSIRVRVKGRAYLCNVTFIDDEDYKRFITSICVKNNVDPTVPTQTFTDDHDENYIMRFSLSAAYIMSGNLPILHIRKVPRKKLMGDDLIRLGMMDEKIMKYLIDCGKFSRGVVFAGPPGSGKTVALNWFLEDAYESSAEILVIQENDELFAYRKGVMFEHVVNNPQKGEKACSLEQLGQMALVAGANVFVIGEAKGAEICSAITLSNSGCRTAITIHSPSSTETVDKMADLAMRGYATSYDQAKRMIKSFQTIVYLQNFKVQEISEIIGYDDEKKDMIYRPIYRRNA